MAAWLVEHWAQIAAAVAITYLHCINRNLCLLIDHGRARDKVIDYIAKYMAQRPDNDGW